MSRLRWVMKPPVYRRMGNCKCTVFRIDSSIEALTVRGEMGNYDISDFKLRYYNNHPLCGYSVGERQERASFLLLMQSIHTFCIGWYLAVCLFLNYTTIFTEYKSRNRCGHRNLAKRL